MGSPSSDLPFYRVMLCYLIITIWSVKYMKVNDLVSHHSVSETSPLFPFLGQPKDSHSSSNGSFFSCTVRLVHKTHFLTTTLTRICGPFVFWWVPKHTHTNPLPPSTVLTSVFSISFRLILPRKYYKIPRPKIGNHLLLVTTKNLRVFYDFQCIRVEIKVCYWPSVYFRPDPSIFYLP